MSVALGVAGIVLPVLPTTPFFLLALWLFGRGSERLRQWLLSNKLFGNYIKNYHYGLGVPTRVKAWTLALLWLTIGFSAWQVNAIWLKISLLAVAIAVTVHILMLGRRKIVVLVPTAEEAAGIPNAIICGIGMAETAATLMKVLCKRPRMVILAGIAGAYPNSELAVGDCVVVASEHIDGLPPQYNKIYDCPWTKATKLPKVAGVTVDSPSHNIDARALENMEGAVFFSMCEAAGTRFLEVRAISNLTTDRRENWRIDDAVCALAAGVKQIFDEIEA
jgi:uncharacterized membrane protein YbaN (DUF454 family)